MQNFIEIQNFLYGNPIEPETSYAHIIKPIGFSILSYLLYHHVDYKVITWKGQIMESLDFDKRTVDKYLSILQNNKLISCNKNLLKAKRKDIIEIDLNDYHNLSGGYELIPSPIFKEQYKIIKDSGWLILCFLCKNFNTKFGSISDTGFTNVSEQFISNILGISKNTVSSYINLLSKQKLITIAPRENIFTGFDENNNEIYNYTPNKYRIPFQSKRK